MATNQKMYEHHSAEIDKLIRMRLGRAGISHTPIYVPGYTYDDLVQEGRMAALEALDGYDDTRGKLSTYLTRVIANAYYGLLGATYAQKRRPPLPLEGEDGLARVAGGEPNAEERAVLIEQIQAVRKAIESAQRRLGEMERTVMSCYMEPPPELLVTIRNLGRRKLSKRALSMYLGISPDRLQSIIHRIQTEMSDSMELDG